MLTLPYTTMYSANFPPPSKQKTMNKDRLPLIVPVGFGYKFLFDHRLRKGAPLSERLRDARRSISLGLGTPRHIRTIHWSTEKPIVRSLRPQDVPSALPAAAADPECCGAEGVASSGSNETIQSINEEDIDWEGLATKRCYTSVTANAAEEGIMHLPSPPTKIILTNTCEPDCDPVRNTTSWTGWRLPRPISIAWDRAHTRIMDAATGTKTEAITTLPRISSQSSSVKVADEKFLKPATKLTFYRTDPIPGYTGYQPRLPVVARPEVHHMTSIARSSYRKFPLCEYKMSYYSRTAPFSRMISLITPYNPFNKIRPTEPLEL